MIKQMTAIGLMLASAHSFALEVPPSTTVPTTTRDSRDVVSGNNNQADFSDVATGGMCSNIPMSYAEAMTYGLKCN